MEPASILDELATLEPHRVKPALIAVPPQAEALRALVPTRLATFAALTATDPADNSVKAAFWWMYVAAAVRASGTHASIVTLFHIPEKFNYVRWGDLSTEDAKVIFADTFEGDLEPLRRLVADERASEWNRQAALRAMLRLVDEDRLDRDVLFSLLTELLEDVLRRRWDLRLDGGTEASTEFGDLRDLATHFADVAVFEFKEPRLVPLVRRVVAARLWNQNVAHLDELEQALTGLDPFPRERAASIPLNVWKHVSWWACFKPLEKGSTPRPARGGKVGRNDPCPCGSGKKFKKCCGA